MIQILQKQKHKKENVVKMSKNINNANVINYPAKT